MLGHYQIHQTQNRMKNQECQSVHLELDWYRHFLNKHQPMFQIGQNQFERLEMMDSTILLREEKVMHLGKLNGFLMHFHLRIAIRFH